MWVISRGDGDWEMNGVSSFFGFTGLQSSRKYPMAGAEGRAQPAAGRVACDPALVKGAGLAAAASPRVARGRAMG